MEKRGISKLDLKRRNRMQILRIIRENGPISRVDVASALEITRAAAKPKRTTAVYMKKYSLVSLSLA